MKRKMRGMALLLLMAMSFSQLVGCTAKTAESQITCIADLAGKRVTSYTGSVFAETLDQQVDNVEHIFLDDMSSQFVALESGKADATLTDVPIAKLAVAQRPDLMLLDELLSVDSYGIAFRKGDPLVPKINEVIERFLEDGTMDAIAEKWISADESKKVIPELTHKSDFDGSAGILKLGHDSVVVPMCYLGDAGEAKGFEIELVTRIAYELNMTLEMTSMNFSSLLTSIASGKSDMIVGCITINEKRKESMDFSTPYYHGGMAVILKKPDSTTLSKPQEITSVSNLAKKRVGVATGTMYEEVLRKSVSDPEISYFDTVADQMDALKTGKLDAFILDTTSATECVRSTTGIKALTPPFGNTEIAFVFDKKNTELADQVNASIQALTNSGELDTLQKKWFGTDNTVKVLPTIPLSAENGTLQVATNSVAAPYVFIKDGKMVGYEVELAMRIAEKLGMGIEITDMDFPAIIPSVTSEKSSFGIGAFAITEERKKNVLFSDPVATDSISAVVADSEASAAIAKLSDLAGKKVGAITGSIYQALVQQSVPDAEVVYFNNMADQIESLKAGKITAFVSEEFVANDFLRTTPSLKMLNPALGSTQIGFALPLENTALATQMNAEILKLKANGELDAIIKKWNGTDEQVKVLLENSAPATNGVLRVATNAIYAPAVYVKNDKVVGYEVEIALRIAQSLGMSLEISNMDFSAIIPSVTSGKSDIGIGRICVTEERKERVLFTEPVSIDNIVAITLKDAALIAIPLETARVGVMTGSTAETTMRSDYPNADLHTFDAISDAVTALNSNKLDYVVSAYTNLLNCEKTYPNLKVFPEMLKDEKNAIAVKKGNTELLTKVNAALDKFKADGTLDEVISHWIKPGNSPYDTVEIPKHETGEILRVAISADREPITFLMNERYVGLDCELIERIAYELGMRVEYQNMKFSGLLSALQANKADLVISNLTRTEERAQSVDFTQTYFDNPQALLGQRSTTPLAKPWYISFVESFKRTFVVENRWKLILQGLFTTVLISVCSALLGTVLGFLICMLRRSKSKGLNVPAKLFIGIIQGTPIVVMLMILYYVLFAKIDINPILVAIIGFAINFSAYVSEMMRSGIDAVDKGQLEAASAIGFNKVAVFVKIIMPQAARHVLPVFKGEFISMVKMTSVVGYIAIQDLTRVSDLIRSRTYEAFFPLIATALIYLALSYIVVFLLSRLEIKVNPKYRKRIVKGVTKL